MKAEADEHLDASPLSREDEMFSAKALVFVCVFVVNTSVFPTVPAANPRSLKS